MSVKFKSEENLYDADDFNIDYLSVRPVYPTTLYDIIYKYHEENGAEWNVAHDAGAGPGNVSHVLLEKFDKVHVSDMSENYVKVSQKRLEKLPMAYKLEFSYHIADNVCGV